MFRKKGEVERRQEQRWIERTGCRLTGHGDLGRWGWGSAGGCEGSQVGFRLTQDHEQPSFPPPHTNKDQLGTRREEEVGAGG